MIQERSFIMNSANTDKITADHLMRDAYLYIRQSSLKQVIENTESTKRQYELKERAITLGWQNDQIVIIDCDLGESAAPGAADRAGFEQLMTEVSMRRVGLVMGLEVSRLARSCSAWHRLLEICAVTNTLVLDQDGLYDVRYINDRLLLGLKAAMSEAELHIIKERMRGGALSKAARGELRVRMSIGFIYDSQNRIVLDPDKQVREAIALFFKTFSRLGSIYKTVIYFRKNGLKFPKRIHCGPTKGDVVWAALNMSRASQMLRCPRYAGVYAYGRSRVITKPSGKSILRDLPMEKWHAMIPDAHPGYISLDEYKQNLRTLQNNKQRFEPKAGRPPREGAALLQGLVICGLCGQRMTVRYCKKGKGLQPKYICGGRGQMLCKPKCQTIPGQSIDEAIGDLLMVVMNPVALEVSLAVHDKVCQRVEEADRLRLRQVERIRYEVDLAKRRYMQVDPANRLVAEELEAQWNHKLRELRKAEEEYERKKEQDSVLIDQEKRNDILSLANDFPALWRNPKTPHREQKRMIALIIEDVTLIKREEISVHVRFKGGASRSFTLPRPLAAYEQWTTSKEVVAEIDRLLDDYTYSEIAEILNKKGYGSGQGRTFDHRRISVIRRAYHLKDRLTRLHEQGYLTANEIAPKLGTTSRMVRVRRAKGTLSVGYKKLSDQGDCMYEDPYRKTEGRTKKMPERTKEV